MRKLDWLIVIALSIFLLIEFTKDHSSKNKSISIGDHIPSLDVMEVMPAKRQAFKFEIGFPRENFTLINFWATWCTSCEREFENINLLHSQTNTNLDLYRLSSYDKLENLWISPKIEKMKGALLFDSDNKVSDFFNVKEFPQSFLLTPEGKVVDRVIGPMQLGDVERIRNLVVF